MKLRLMLLLLLMFVCRSTPDYKYVITCLFDQDKRITQYVSREPYIRSNYEMEWRAIDPATGMEIFCTAFGPVEE